MPIFETDLKVMHSGGASNDLPSASLGGDISAVEVSNSVHAVFGVISSQVANAGSMEYRCVYIKNNHASLHWYNAVVWISSNTPSNKTEVQIALGLSAVNGSETAVATATTAPGRPAGAGSCRIRCEAPQSRNAFRPRSRAPGRGPRHRGGGHRPRQRDLEVVRVGIGVGQSRGARGLAPENSLPSFELAMKLGVTTLETDVGISRDGVLVISHDPALNPDLTRGPDFELSAVAAVVGGVPHVDPALSGREL